MNIPTGCTIKETKGGHRLATIHYSADPSKNAAWVEEHRRGQPIREWLREMELRDDIYDGEPVFGDYNDDLHCPEWARTTPIPVVNEAFFLGGWDAGQTLMPAFVLLQIAPPRFRIQALLEVIPPCPMPMATFAPLVMQELQKRLPGNWMGVEHFGDATIGQHDGSRGETAKKIAKQVAMIDIKPVPNAWQPRYSAVTWALTEMLDERSPRFLVDGVNCPVLREGFKGAYQWVDSKRGDQVVGSPGRILAQPLKNLFSHVQDALQYPMMRARRYIMLGK